MATFIEFDGDFRQVARSWFKDLEPDEDWKHWLVRNGFNDYPLCGTFNEDHDTVIRSLQIYENPKEAKWYVVCCSGGRPFQFVIEGQVNYLKFMASPMCAMIDLHEDLRALRATVQAAFTAWHGHAAPNEINDHDLATSCSKCDPGFDEMRDEQRQRLQEKASVRETLEDIQAVLEKKIGPIVETLISEKNRNVLYSFSSDKFDPREG